MVAQFAVVNSLWKSLVQVAHQVHLHLSDCIPMYSSTSSYLLFEAGHGRREILSGFFRLDEIAQW